MISDIEYVSEEESYEMENVSETTRLVSREDKNADSPARSVTKFSPPSSPDKMRVKQSGSFSNKGVALDEYDGNINRSDAPTKYAGANVTVADSDSHSVVETKTTFFVLLLAAFSAIGGFLFGYDTGVVSGAMLLLRDDFKLTSIEQELIVSVTIGAACLSALSGGFLSDQFGRRFCTILASLIFTAGALVLGFAQNVTMLIIGRLTLGLGIGLASMTVPVYIAEVAPSHLRGRLLTVNVLFITGGQFIASLLDGAFSYLEKDGWRYMLGLAGVPSFIQLIGFLFLPESPRYLVMKGNEVMARQVLYKVRGTKNVEEELEEIKENCRQDEEADKDFTGPTILRMLKSSNMRRALVVGCGLQFFQQLSGINTVMYYSASIIKMAGIHDQHTAIWLAAMTAGVNFVFTLVGVWLVERIGRKPLILSSLAGVILSLVVLAVGFQLDAFNSPRVTLNESTVGFQLHASIPPYVTQDAYRNYNSCSGYSSCERCIDDKECGYCYTDSGRSVTNGSCLLATHDFMYSEAGRCSANASDNAVVWAYDYCPTPYSWMAIAGLTLYLMFFAPGMGPMPWTINAEIYPLWARSTGNSLSAATNWISNLVVSMTFLTLTETITKYGTYWLFMGIAILGFIFFFFRLPETKGRTLEDVEELFATPWCTCCTKRRSKGNQLS